jgi:hypothetical protein
MIPLADIIASGSLRRSSAGALQRRSDEPYTKNYQKLPPSHSRVTGVDGRGTERRWAAYRAPGHSGAPGTPKTVVRNSEWSFSRLMASRAAGL